MKETLVRLMAFAALACFLAGLFLRSNGGDSVSRFTILGILLAAGSMLLAFRFGSDDDDDMSP